MFEKVWTKVKAAALWAKDNLLWPILTVLVAIGTIILVSMGLKGSNVGGLLGKLLEKDATPPPDSDRKVEPGVPDDLGQTEVVVAPIEVEDGHIVLPETETPVILPEGVEPDEVKEVIVVTPVVTNVKVTDTSPKPVTNEDLNRLLEKIGRK